MLSAEPPLPLSTVIVMTHTIMFLLHMAVCVDGPGQCCLLMCEAQRTWSSHPCFTLQTERISQKLAAAEQKASNQYQRLQDATQNLNLAAQCSADGSKQTSMLAKQVLLVQSADKHSHASTYSIQCVSSDIMCALLHFPMYLQRLRHPTVEATQIGRMEF